MHMLCMLEVASALMPASAGSSPLCISNGHLADMAMSPARHRLVMWHRHTDRVSVATPLHRRHTETPLSPLPESATTARLIPRRFFCAFVHEREDQTSGHPWPLSSTKIYKSPDGFVLRVLQSCGFRADRARPSTPACRGRSPGGRARARRPAAAPRAVRG